MRTALTVLTLLVAFSSIGCSTAPQTAAERQELVRDARAKLSLFQEERPGTYRAYIDSAYGMAVFPHIGKGGYGIGGARGQGVVFEGNRLVGYCDMTAVSIGFQLGGQEYTQIIFFETEAALTDFKSGEITGAAQASAVAGSADASASADYENGVAVYTVDSDGLMYEASIGGQQFDYVPASAFND